MQYGDCFYARFQDDIILVSPKRHVLKRMRKKMYQILDELRLILRPEKTFVGRCHKGFDLLGYDITPKGFSPSQKTQEKALETAKRRYAQGGKRSLQSYLYRWRTWVHAGLPFKIQGVDEAANKIKTDSIAFFTDLLTKSELARKRQKCLSCNPARFFASISSDHDRSPFNGKGKQSCKKNFSDP